MQIKLYYQYIYFSDQTVGAHVMVLMSKFVRHVMSHVMLGRGRARTVAWTLGHGMRQEFRKRDGVCVPAEMYPYSVLQSAVRLVLKAMHQYCT